MAGTTCVADDPVPTTATTLPVRSCSCSQRGVELRALEVVEPGPVGVAGHVEEADRAHEHVALLDAAVVEPQLPDVAVVVPRRRLHGHAELQVRRRPNSSTVSSRYCCSSACRVRARPVVRLEREAVEVRADVDLGAGVGVVPPRAPDPERRLVDRERVDAGASAIISRAPASPHDRRLWHEGHHGSRRGLLLSFPEASHHADGTSDPLEGTQIQISRCYVRVETAGQGRFESRRVGTMAERCLAPLRPSDRPVDATNGEP